MPLPVDTVPEKPSSAPHTNSFVDEERKAKTIVPIHNRPAVDVSWKWYAVHTMSHSETKVAHYLEAFGVETFMPDYPSRSQWHDRMKILRRPLFPGYLFARLQRKLPAKVLGAPGLVHVVGFADGPIPIPDDQIETVRRLVSAGPTVYGCPLLKVGKRVRICGGALKGVEGYLEKIRNRFRLVVSVELLCRSVAVEVNPESIELLS